MNADEEMKVRVALVEQSYNTLDRRLQSVEAKIDVIHNDIKNSNIGLIKVIVGSAGTILAGCLSVVTVILMKL
jgi:tetrahydromethanopterin S-methyltransferase subunit G